MNKLYFFLLAICFAGSAHAQFKPPCYPHQLGSTGSGFKRGSTDTHRWIAWTCTTKTKTTLVVYSAPKSYEIIDPDTSQMTPIKAAEAYILANVKATPDAGAVAAAQAAFK